MKENGIMTAETVMENIYLKMEENIKVNGLMVLKKAKECSLI